MCMPYIGGTGARARTRLNVFAVVGNKTRRGAIITQYIYALYAAAGKRILVCSRFRTVTAQHSSHATKTRARARNPVSVCAFTPRIEKLFFLPPGPRSLRIPLLLAIYIYIYRLKTSIILYVLYMCVYARSICICVLPPPAAETFRPGSDAPKGRNSADLRTNIHCKILCIVLYT